MELLCLRDSEARGLVSPTGCNKFSLVGIYIIVYCIIQLSVFCVVACICTLKHNCGPCCSVCTSMFVVSLFGVDSRESGKNRGTSGVRTVGSLSCNELY